MKYVLKKTIAELSNEIFNVILKSGLKTDSCGIKNGNEIITEYLNKNELGLAYEHLEYIVFETDFSLISEQNEKINLIAKQLELKKDSNEQTKIHY